MAKLKLLAVLLAVLLTAVVYSVLLSVCWPSAPLVTSDVVLALVGSEAEAPRLLSWPGPVWRVASVDLLVRKLSPGQVSLVLPAWESAADLQVSADMRFADTLTREDAALLCMPGVEACAFGLRKTPWLDGVRWPSHLDSSSLRACVVKAAAAAVDGCSRTPADCERLVSECRHALVSRARFFESQPASLARRTISWILWK
jgi:hypothetical protein